MKNVSAVLKKVTTNSSTKVTLQFKFYSYLVWRCYLAPAWLSYNVYFTCQTELCNYPFTLQAQNHHIQSTDGKWHRTIRERGVIGDHWACQTPAPVSKVTVRRQWNGALQNTMGNMWKWNIQSGPWECCVQPLFGHSRVSWPADERDGKGA